MLSPLLLSAGAWGGSAQSVSDPELALASPMRPPWNLLEVLAGGQNQLCHTGGVNVPLLHRIRRSTPTADLCYVLITR